VRGAGATLHFRYVIDTGILTSHVDFAGRASSGYDAVGGRGEGSDCNGHGTHVAGTVGGSTWGIAKDVALVAVRVLNCRGSGTWSGVIAGIDWVTANFASITATSKADVTKYASVTVTVVSEPPAATIDLEAGSPFRRGQNFIVPLSWTGSMNVAVYANGGLVGTVSGSSANVNMGKTAGTARFEVCDTGTGTCSNEVSVTYN
jgi:subtilisin family serine protease